MGYHHQGKAEGKEEEAGGLTVIIDPTTYSNLDFLAHDILEEVGRRASDWLYGLRFLVLGWGVHCVCCVCCEDQSALSANYTIYLS